MGEDPSDVLRRPTPPPDVTVRYGPGPEHVADVRWPTSGHAGPSGGAPLVVVIHGGFWRAEYDRRHTGPQCHGLAGAGFVVAAIEYRRTGQPGGGWPGTFDDVAAALDAVPGLVATAAAGAGRRVDPGRTVLVGHSAGGQLAAWAALTPRPGIVGAVSLAGVLDLARAAELGLDPAPGGPAVQALLGGPPDAVPHRYAAADPSRLPPPAIPVVAMHGDADTVVPPDLSARYARVTGQPLVLLPGAGHFGPIDPTASCWPDVLDRVRAAAADTHR